jgi:hypothetical protein
MQINPTNNLTPLPERRRVAGANTPTGRDEANFATTESLQAALRGAPEVRMEKVEQARALIGKSVYPPEETIAKIANLMAMHVDWRAE